MNYKEKEKLSELISLFSSKQHKEVKTYFLKNKNYFRNHIKEIAIYCLGNNNKYINILKELKNLQNLSYAPHIISLNYEEEYNLIKNSTNKELECYVELCNKKEQLIDIVFKLNEEEKIDILLLNYINSVELYQYILDNKLENYYYLTKNVLLNKNKKSSYLITECFLNIFAKDVNNEKLEKMFNCVNILDCQNLKELNKIFFDEEKKLINYNLLTMYCEENLNNVIKLFEKIIKAGNYYISQKELNERLEKIEIFLNDYLNSRLMLKNF